MSLFKRANEKLRSNSYEDAIRLYVEALLNAPSLAHLVNPNLSIAKSRYIKTRAISKPPKVVVCGWDLSNNCAGRVATLAQTYEAISDVAIIGFFFPKRGNQLWAPLRNLQISIHPIEVEHESLFLGQALELVLQNPCDILHLSKPRLPNILIGLLYKLVWGASVILDIDDEELAFVGASESILLFDYLQEYKALPSLDQMIGKEWTQISVGLSQAFDGITVVNKALQQKYGGLILRHARDENNFKPSTFRRQIARETLGISFDKKVIIFLGTPRAHKGLKETAQAIASLKRRDILYLIVGNFPASLESLKSEIESLKGVDTKFLDNQPFETIPDILAAGDICVLLQDPNDLAARYQTPAKLSDALAMGLIVLAERTPGLSDLGDLGAFHSVDRVSLETTLSNELDRNFSMPTPHPLFVDHLSLGANSAILSKLLIGAIDGRNRAKSELNQDLTLLAEQACFAPLLPALMGINSGDVRVEESSLSPLKFSLINRQEVIVDASEKDIDQIIRLAEQANAADEWPVAHAWWKSLLSWPKDELSIGLLIRLSQELFKLDAFSDAAQALQMAANLNPEHPGVLCEQASQYYYHCYSSWLMLITENEPDWYKVDGLEVRPDWETACLLIEKAEKASPRNNLRRYIQAYLLLAEEAWDNQKSKEAYASLDIALKAIGPNKLDKTLIQAIFAAIDQFRHGQVNEKDLYFQALQDQIKSLSIDLLSVPDWLCLNDFLNWNGLLLCGYVAREKGVDLALAQGKAKRASKDNLKTALKAALDRNDTATADEFLGRLKQISPDTVDVRELDSCCELMKGNLDAFRQKWPHPPKQAERQLREYLKGKTVAVVGPAPTGTLDGEEIDRFDIVVRANVRKLDAPLKTQEFGARTEGSTYNAHTTRLLNKKNEFNFLTTNLDWIFIRRPTRFVSDGIDFRGSKIVLQREWPCSINKSLNSIQCLVFNLILSGAVELKVFKTNNYTGSVHHIDGYRPYHVADASASSYLRRIRPVLANHDLVSNNVFNFQLSHCCTTIGFDKPSLVAARLGRGEIVKKINFFADSRFQISKGLVAPSNPYHHIRQPKIKQWLDNIKGHYFGSYNDAIRDIRRQAYNFSDAYKNLERLKDIHLGKRCFIIGNGPSLKNQNLGLLKDEITFVTNWFVNVEKYLDVDPKYYCVSSHEMFGGWNKPDPKLNEDFYSSMQLKAKNSIKFFSYAFHDYIRDSELFMNEDVYYLLFERPKHLIDEINAFNVKLDQHLDDAYTVVLTMCVPLALHMGIKEIYFIGCDCDYGIIEPSDMKQYFYDSSLHKTTTTKFENLQRIWRVDGPIFAAYEIASKVAKAHGATLFNATSGGKLEVLPRVEYNRLFSQYDMVEHRCRKLNLAFCTVLNDDFVPGFLVTLYSLIQKNPWFDYVYYIFYSDNYSPLSDLNMDVIRRIYTKIVFKKIDDKAYHHIWNETKERLNTPARLRPAFFIIEAFSLIMHDRVVCLDADLVILRDIQELVNTSAGFSACQAVDYKNNKSKNFFNSGVMVLNKPILSNQTYRRLLMHKISDSYKTSFGKADQAILNDFFAFSDVNLLPERFNVTKRKYHDNAVLDSKIIEDDDVCILHYVGEKPWVSDKYSPEEHSYLKAESLWQRVFNTLALDLMGINSNLSSKFRK